MTPGTGALLAVVFVMACNQLVMRVGALKGHPAFFYPLQLLNLLAAAALIWFGLPGLDHLPIVSWLVALLFLFHSLQNSTHRARWLRERFKAEREERARRARSIVEERKE